MCIYQQQIIILHFWLDAKTAFHYPVIVHGNNNKVEPLAFNFFFYFKLQRRESSLKNGHESDFQFNLITF